MSTATIASKPVPSCLALRLPADAISVGQLIRDLTEIRNTVAQSDDHDGQPPSSSFDGSIRNLNHYLAFRRFDIRPYQDTLAALGISSLGRSESHILQTLDAVLRLLRLIEKEDVPQAQEAATDLLTARRLLNEHTTRLLGPRPNDRQVRVMVTMPADAADDYSLVRDLLSNGMDCMRINCAHDDQSVWARIISHLRTAECELGRSCRVLMDLAGPKLRTGAVAAGEKIRLSPGDRLIVTRERVPGHEAAIGTDGTVTTPASIACEVPEIFAYVRAGEPIAFDDGKISGVIEETANDRLTVRIERTAKSGIKLGAQKGINLPDSCLELRALTEADTENLAFVATHADLIGLSFIEDVADIERICAALDDLCAEWPGLILKIETKRAFRELPRLLAAALRRRPTGVMIARGDLAIECGFERLAEVQEEILWLCEAAHVPVIWATQVLENMAQTGIPSRAEISDAAMAVQAECVMLNKGPHIVDAVRLLNNILVRMETHQMKKTALLRSLKSWPVEL